MSSNPPTCNPTTHTLPDYDQPPHRDWSCGSCGRQNLTFQGFHDQGNLTKRSLQLLAQQQQQQHPWSTTECNQPAAWKTNRSLLVVFRVKVFPGRPTNSGSTLPRAAHLDGGVIGCHQCITSHSGGAPTSPDMQPAPWLHPACISSTTSIPAPTKTTIAMTNYTHVSTVTNSSATLP